MCCKWCDKEAVWVIVCFVGKEEPTREIKLCDDCHAWIYPFLDGDVSSLDAKRFAK